MQVYTGASHVRSAMWLNAVDMGVRAGEGLGALGPPVGATPGDDVGRGSFKARLVNQSILKEIIPEYSLEGLMLKLKLQYFAHLL